MSFRDPVALGRTGLRVGRLGVASGYWAPADAIETAFEHGCNYFTWGTFIRGRSPHMAAASSPTGSATGWCTPCSATPTRRS